MIGDHNLKIPVWEYRDLDLPSYSMLSSISKAGVDIMNGDKSNGIFSLKFGSLVDDMCFETDVVMDKYYMNMSVSNPTKNVKDIVDYVLAGINKNEKKEETESFSFIKKKPISSSFVDSSNLEDYKSQILLGAKANNVYAKYSEDKIIKTVLDAGTDYFKDSILCRGKVQIKKEMWDKAMETSKTLATHQFSKKYFTPEPGVELIYQYKFTAKVNGTYTKGMLDIVMINHNTKKIYPVDLKTGELPAGKFNEVFLMHGYYIQASLYKEALRYIVSNDFELDGYTVENFEFLYISKDNVNKPIIWVVSEKIHQASLSGFTDTYGIKHKGVHGLLKEYTDCKQGMYCEYTEDVYKNEGRIMFDDDLIRGVIYEEGKIGNNSN